MAMTPEEYQRYKEAEKAHLRKLKELKKAVHTLERQKSVTQATEKVAEGNDLLEKQKDLVDELALETARHEARLDVALDSAAEAEKQAEMEALEEELQRERAQALVRQLKRQMGGEEEPLEAQPGFVGRRGDPVPSPTVAAPPSDEDSDAGTASRHPTPGRDDRPEKTIGRM